MARTKKKWSYSTGERGRNRVRALEHASGMLMLEFNDLGTRRRISLKHRNRDQATQQAEAAAAKLGRAEDLKPEDGHFSFAVDPLSVNSIVNGIERAACVTVEAKSAASEQAAGFSWDAVASAHFTVYRSHARTVS